MRSLLSDTRIEIEFTNYLDEIVEVWWINFHGQEEFWFELLPNERRSQETFVTHPWVVRKKSGKVRVCSVNATFSRSVDIGPRPSDPQVFVGNGAPSPASE